MHTCMNETNFRLPLLLKTLTEMHQQISPLKLSHHITAKSIPSVLQHSGKKKKKVF